MKLPFDKDSVTSAFGNRIHPITKQKSFHSGVDFGKRAGTSIPAAHAGKVIWAGPSKLKKANGEPAGYGYFIRIRHRLGVSTLYGHTQAGSFQVKVGDRVTEGQTIAKVGSTGDSTGPHLHFEVSVNGKPRDPFIWVPILNLKLKKKG